jgi:hypothetical protein
MRPPPPVGLSLLVYFAPGGPAASARAAIDIYQEYVDQASSELRWFGDSITERKRPFDDDCRAFPEIFLTKDGEINTRVWHAYGGDERSNRSPWYFQASLSEDGEAGFIKLSWATNWIQGKQATFVDYVKRVCASLPCLSAYGGFAFTNHDYADYSGKMRAMATQRFMCIDWDEPSIFRLSATKGVRSASWLTIIGETFLGSLGGVPSADKLPGIEIHQCGGGCLLRAGEMPIAGDVNAEEDLSLYHRVGRYIRPVAARPASLWAPIGDSKTWLTRFDG